MKKKVFFGGAFDPFHIGHASLIEAAFDYFKGNLEVFLVPTAKPVEKKSPVLPVYHRIAMLETLLEKYSFLRLNLCEFELEAPSYTYNSLKHLNSEHSNQLKYLLIGEDQWQHFSSWYKADEIQLENIILVGKRPLKVHKSVFPNALLSKNVVMLDNVTIDCASSTLRQESFDTWHSYVPKEIFNYINTHQLTL